MQCRIRGYSQETKAEYANKSESLRLGKLEMTYDGEGQDEDNDV